LPRTLKLTVAYDGTEFSGWQRQASARTVQAVLEDTLAPIEKRIVTIVGAGRTDAGVHAAAQVASVSIESAISIDELHRALNATLPDDLRVIAIEEAAADFSARRDACLKTYHYSIWNGISVPPLLRRYVLHVPQPLDLAVMNEGASMLVGEHDFAAFQAGGSEVKTTVRGILSSTVREVDATAFATIAHGDRLLCYEVTGTGFLRHMVRKITGTLIDCGWRAKGAADMRAVLESRDRSRAGATAPAHGLVLWKVEYGP
jgi:tRNA pseudouridine38-40 synthase